MIQVMEERINAANAACHITLEVEGGLRPVNNCWWRTIEMVQGAVMAGKIGNEASGEQAEGRGTTG